MSVKMETWCVAALAKRNDIENLSSDEVDRELKKRTGWQKRGDQSFRLVQAADPKVIAAKSPEFRALWERIAQLTR